MIIINIDNTVMRQRSGGFDSNWYEIGVVAKIGVDHVIWLLAFGFVTYHGAGNPNNPWFGAEFFGCLP